MTRAEYTMDGRHKPGRPEQIRAGRQTDTTDINFNFDKRSFEADTAQPCEHDTTRRDRTGLLCAHSLRHNKNQRGHTMSVHRNVIIRKRFSDRHPQHTNIQYQRTKTLTYQRTNRERSWLAGFKTSILPDKGVKHEILLYRVVAFLEPVLNIVVAIWHMTAMSHHRLVRTSKISSLLKTLKP